MHKIASVVIEEDFTAHARVSTTLNISIFGGDEGLRDYPVLCRDDDGVAVDYVKTDKLGKLFDRIGHALLIVTGGKGQATIGQHERDLVLQTDVGHRASINNTRSVAINFDLDPINSIRTPCGARAKSQGRIERGLNG